MQSDARDTSSGMLKIFQLKTAQDKSIELFSSHYSKIFDFIGTIDIIDPEKGHISVHIWFANIDIKSYFVL